MELQNNFWEFGYFFKIFLGHRNGSPMSHNLNLDFKKIPEGPKMRRLKIWKK